MIDTDVISYVFGGKIEAAKFVPHLHGYIGAVAFVTVGELLKGALKANWSQRRTDAMLDYVQGNYVVVPYNIQVAEEWAFLVDACRRGGYVPGQNDSWIAASAVAFGCPLVANDRGFKAMADHYPKLHVLP